MDYIAEPLRSLAVPIAELHEDPSNARKGHAVERIAASLKQYGQRKPIVVNRAQGGKVEAGNGTLAAAKSLGWTHIAAVFVDDDAATAAAYGIADNRVGEFSEWDADILGDLIPTLDGLFTGFLPAELDAILPQQHTEGDTEPQIDRAEELRQKWGVESGQMWRLGEHRIICGDCTDAAVVARVMGGERAQACVTDPPYGVGLEYGGYEDSESNLADIALRFLPLARELCEVVGLTPGNGNQKHYPYSDWTLGWFFASGMNRVSWGFQNWQPVLVWGKDPYLARGLGARPDAFWISEKMEKSAHPCAKPIETWNWLVQRLSPEKGAIVYDPFSGSGTTIIACEQLGRKCRAVEISPGYVAVAIERWATHTGGTPELLP